jgi:hypothetical protein
MTDPSSAQMEPWVRRGAEFGMLVCAADSPVPLIDTTVSHAEAAVEDGPAPEPVPVG